MNLQIFIFIIFSVNNKVTEDKFGSICNSIGYCITQENNKISMKRSTFLNFESQQLIRFIEKKKGTLMEMGYNNLCMMPDNTLAACPADAVNKYFTIFNEKNVLKIKIMNKCLTSNGSSINDILVFKGCNNSKSQDWSLKIMNDDMSLKEKSKNMINNIFKNIPSPTGRVVVDNVIRYLPVENDVIVDIDGSQYDKK
ncbi:hypothetical protein DMUE_5627 [Dictyocoela muelleri]|nr:hypothetical protein DMUE_5627 [Dictyocoela muelleri]